MDPYTLQTNLDSLLPGVADQETAEFDQRRMTVAAFGQIACWVVAEEHGDQTAELYADSLWNYRQFRQFSQTERQDPPGTAPQVFRRWYDLTTHQMDLLPVTFETAKKTGYGLSLLGAAVMAHVIKTPISKELLSDYHQYRLEQLTNTTTSA